MSIQRGFAALGLLVVGTLFIAPVAGAIPLPDSSSCTSSAPCLQITNLSTSVAAKAIWGIDSNGFAIIGETNTRVGVWGSADSSGTGVFGDTQSGMAVHGVSSTGNGVVGENGRKDQAAAAISALSGDPISGLAYWGTGSIIVTGDGLKPGGGMWSNYSDARVKRDVHPFKSGIEELREVRPVTYKYNGLGGTTDSGREYVGVIAQELEKVFPDMVKTRKGKLHPTDDKETDIKLVDPSAFTFVLINAVKEQQQIIDRQEHRLAALERGRSTSLSASVLGGGTWFGFGLGLLPLGFAALRKRKERNAQA